MTGVVFLNRTQVKIVNIVVQLVTVNVVNHFAFRQGST